MYIFLLKLDVNKQLVLTFFITKWLRTYYRIYGSVYRWIYPPYKTVQIFSLYRAFNAIIYLFSSC